MVCTYIFNFVIFSKFLDVLQCTTNKFNFKLKNKKNKELISLFSMPDEVCVKLIFLNKN